MFKIFDYTCEPCKLKEERIVYVDEIDTQKCTKCEQLMNKEFPAPKGYVDYPAAGRGTRV